MYSSLDCENDLIVTVFQKIELKGVVFKMYFLNLASIILFKIEHHLKNQVAKILCTSKVIGMIGLFTFAELLFTKQQENKISY